MNCKRIIGIIIAIIGIGAIILSFYIKQMVVEKVGQAKANASALTESPLTDLGGPNAKMVGKQINKKVDKMADEKAREYNQIADWILYGGIGAIVIGIGVAAFSKGKK